MLSPKNINILHRFTLTLFLATLTSGIKSQNGPAIQFSANSRFDFIGLKNAAHANHYAVHGEADAAISINSDNLGLFRGGEFYAQVMDVFGNRASERYTGDIQVFSNIESDSRLFLYQCYYKQTLGNLILKLGQMDLNAEYSVSGYGSSLINSSFGVIPTISLNMPASIFSYLSAGISFKYIFSPRVSVQTAFFDGDPGDYYSNRHNLNWHFSRSEGFLNISEIHFKTKSNLKQGKYKAGFFYHSKDLSNPLNPNPFGNFGYYFMGDQQLTSEKNTIKNGLSIFFEFSSASASMNMISRYYAVGFIYRGIFNKMNEDECTLAIASAHLGKTYLIDNTGFLTNETAIELTYKKFLLPNFIIQPDFQYIINCGSTKGNATVGLVRTIMVF